MSIGNEPNGLAEEAKIHRCFEAFLSSAFHEKTHSLYASGPQSLFDGSLDMVILLSHKRFHISVWRPVGVVHLSCFFLLDKNEEDDILSFPFSSERRFGKMEGEVKKMFRKNDLQQLIQQFKQDKAFNEQIIHWHTIDEKPAQLVDMPAEIDDRIKKPCIKEGLSNYIPTKVRHFSMRWRGRASLR